MGEDDELVYYCEHCLSLNVRRLPCNLDYCADCNCANVAQTTNEKWEKMWKEKYHEDFLTKKTKTQ